MAGSAVRRDRRKRFGETGDRKVERRAEMRRRPSLVEQRQCLCHKGQGFRHLFEAAGVEYLALHIFSLVIAR